MISLTTGQIAEAVHGILHGSETAAVTAVSTDSRNIAPGSWFVPLKGERFDGHDYIGKALQAGAMGCFCAQTLPDLPKDTLYIQVEDTKKALASLAGWYRRQFALSMVQITGSMGKTTCKELLAAVLSQRLCVLKTPGNLNGDIGTPLTLLSLMPEHQIGIIETGMDAPGQIDALGALIEPDYAVITCVDDVHLEHFSSREDILHAKAEILHHLRPGGMLALNGDDPLLRTLHPNGCRVVLCGFGGDCDVRVAECEDRGLWGIRCLIETPRGKYPLEISSPGVHMAMLCALVVAVAEDRGLTAADIACGVAAYAPADNRLRVERLPGNRLMINDSYNANPRSVCADLQILAQYKDGRRLALLGDMTELGSAEEEGHRMVGRMAGAAGVTTLLAVGERSRRFMVPEAIAVGCPDVRWFPDRDSAKDALLSVFGEGDCLLLKASHFICRFDLVADFLRDYPF